MEGAVFLKLSRKLLISLFFIPFLSYGQGFVSVCDRTPQVKEAIMDKVHDEIADTSIECIHDDLMMLILSEIVTLHIGSETEDDLFSSLFSNKVSSLKEGDFSGMPNLERLTIRNGELTTLPEGIFSGLSRLRDIYLNHNHLSTLPEGIFSPLSRLRNIYLNHNHLSTLPEGIFSSLPRLTVIGLSDNQLSSLPEGLFSSLRVLGDLDLSNNQLSTLPSGIFSSSSSLKFLYLNDNRLSTLPSGIFSNNSFLLALDLRNNQIFSLPSPSDIFSIHAFSNCFRVRCSIYLFGNPLGENSENNLRKYFRTKDIDIHFD